MSPPSLVLIAALGRNHIIGKDFALPWHLPDDTAWFYAKTDGHVVIMGLNTLYSLPQKQPLPNRNNIVVSHEKPKNVETGIYWVKTLEDGLALGRRQAIDAHQDEVFVIGGGQIYAQTLPLADRLYLTHVDAAPEGDTFFPIFDAIRWRKTILKKYGAVKNRPAFSIMQYDRN